MEFNREVLLQQQQQQLEDFKIQSSLCPPTPAKRAPTQSSISSNVQKYHKSPEPNWPKTLQGPTKTRRIGEDAVFTDCSSSSSSSHSSRSTMLTYNPAEGGWRQTPGTNPIDWNPFFTLLLQSQIGDGLETQVHPNQLLFDNVPPNPNLSNGISPSTPKSMGNTINVGAIDGLPSSHTPETMEKNKHFQEYLHREVTSLVQERESGEKALVFDSENWPSQIANQVNICFSNNMVPAAYKSVVSTSSDSLIPSSSEFVEPLQVLFSDQQQNEVRAGISTGQDGQLLNAQNHELEQQGIDLNRTPQNKSKRIKHRPKVIQEGKPVRTPKPRTPKPATPKAAMINEESPTGKRNYVRDKMGQSSSGALSSMLKDIVDQKNSNSRKSVRRCLNFDSDPPEARDVCPVPTMTPTHGIQLETLPSCLQGTINNSSTMSTIQLAPQSDGVMENAGSGMPLDLNGSVHQMPYVYVRSSKKKNSILQPSRGQKFRTNQNLDHSEFKPEKFAAPSDMGISSNHLNDTTTVDRNPETSEVQSDSGGVSSAMLKQTKRTQNVVRDPYISNYRDFMRAFGGISQLNECPDMSDHDLYFPTSFKKNRTENQDNELLPNASFVGANMPTNDWREKCIELNNHLMALEELQASQQILDFGKIDKQRAAMTVQSHEPNSVSSTSDIAQTTTPLNHHQMLSPMKPFRGSDRDERERFENQKRNAAHPVRTNSNVKPKRCTKNGQAQLANPQLPNTSPIVKKNHDPTALVSVDLREKISPPKTSPKSQNDSSFKKSHGDNLMSVVIKPCGDTMDDLTEYIGHISITETHARAITENALVPYVVDSTIVPYNIARRRHTRPKVDLDEETFRVWNLLMGKGENDCVEGKDSGKKKWWEEERKVFRGRVDSFIARMHLVQGDRRFSKWKGSVVDSVVGVFLTQNVSDHLSSSAFMALSARFPLKSEGNNEATHGEKKGISMEMQERCSASLDYSGKLQDHMLSKDLHCIGSQAIMGENESSNSNESLASDTRGCINDCPRKFLDTNETLVGCETPHNSSIGVSLGPTGKTSLAEAEGRWSFDDAASSKNYVVSSRNSENQVQTADRTELNSQSNLQDEDLITGRIFNGIGSSPSFVELLLMAERIQPENFPSGVFQLGYPILEKKSTILDPSCSLGISTSPSGNCFFNNFSRSGLEDMMSANVISDDSRSKQLLGASGMINAYGDKPSESSANPSAITATKITGQEKLALVQSNKLEEDSCASTNKHFLQPATISETEACIGKKFYHNDNIQKEEGETSTSKSFSKRYSHVVDENAVEIQQRENDKFAESTNRIQTQMKNLINQHNLINFCNKDSNPLEVFQGVKSNLNNEVCNAQRVSAETITKLEEKTVKVKKDKKGTFDWDSLRRGAYQNGTKKERNNDTMDSIDWEAVRCAEVEDISDTIRERGMNNKLAERIKDFLNRVVEDHGSIDLEWLRDVEPDKVKDYLLSIQGLGLKSVECVRLLTLQHLAFPVDTNVGRICVRLGWVPLQPLPESLQLHLLELYPMLETIQKYLWPRLCKLDQRTLYELHYQMITFGKVFCTKSKPNCNACPMRGECKHFASAFASARLALPGPEEKSLASSTPLATYVINHAPELQPVKPLQIEVNRDSNENNCCYNCEPIIEEPSTPEAEQLDTEESTIEDTFYEDPDEIPTINLNIEEFTQNLHNYMQEHNLESIDDDMSKALVAINPEAASIPTPKLKNISRLRTEHHVYELPDSHPLLEGWEQRERDDPSSYLLAIWTPGETAQSLEPPEAFCNSQGTGKLCSSTSCFSCNSIREAEAQTVRGTLLIPCRTAMKGSFPLNGTYFQVNEVFADHDTSRNPINVPRKWIWNLPRRTVYFGTSIPTIFKGLSTPEIQQCFWRGFVCVRGFDRTTRAPRPLYARLHFPASKAPRNKKAPAAKKEKVGDKII